MASLKYRWQAIFDNLRLVSAHWAEQKEEDKKRNAPRKIQLNFVCSLVLGQGRKERDITPEMAEALGLNWKCKVSPDVYQSLRTQETQLDQYLGAGIAVTGLILVIRAAT